MMQTNRQCFIIAFSGFIIALPRFIIALSVNNRNMVHHTIIMNIMNSNISFQVVRFKIISFTMEFKFLLHSLAIMLYKMGFRVPCSEYKT